MINTHHPTPDVSVPYSAVTLPLATLAVVWRERVTNPGRVDTLQVLQSQCLCLHPTGTAVLDAFQTEFKLKFLAQTRCKKEVMALVIRRPVL